MSLRLWLRKWLVCLFGMGLISALAMASKGKAEQTPKRLTPEQQAQLKERDSLAAEARQLGQTGKTAEMIAAWEKKIVIERTVFGSVHEQVAQSLSELARMQEDREDFRAAVQARRESLALRVKMHGEKDWRVTDARLDLEDSERLSKLTPQSRQRLREAAALNSQVVSLWERGRSRDALALARRALEIRQEILGENHRDSMISMFNLGTQYDELKRFAEAKSLYEQALTLRKKLLGEEHPDYAESLNNLATLYQDMGDYRKALPLYELTLALRKKLLGEEHPDYAQSLSNLALLHRAMGDYRKALPLLEETLALRKKLLGEGHPDYAYSLNILALLYQDLGDYRKALPLSEKSLALRKKLQGERHPGYANSLNDLAGLYWSMGDYRKALPLLEESLALRKKLLVEGHPDYAQSLNNLAGLYKDMGDYRKALPLFEQSLALRKKLLGEGHPDYTNSLHNLAGLYQAMGDYRKALPLYEQALALRKKLLGEEHPDYARSLHNLATLHLANRQPVQAAAFCTEALTRQRTFLDRIFTALAGRQRLDFLNQQRRFLDVYLTIASQIDLPAADSYVHVLAWKGAVAARHAEERIARDQPNLQPQVEELRQLRAGLARLVRFTPTNAEQQADSRRRFGDMERRKEELETTLALQSDSYRRFLELRQATARKVADTLPDHTALVDFLEYNHYSPPPKGEGRLTRERRFLAFVLVPGRKPVVVPLGLAEPIDRAVQAWRQPMQSAPASRIDDQAATELRRRVWQPLQEHLGDATSVLLAPDGALTALPFAALPGRKPGIFLIEDITIGHVASGRQLLELASDAQRSPGRGLLAVGDLPYGTAPDVVPLAAAHGAIAVGPLPGTRRELDRIRAAHRQAWPDERVTMLTGAAIDADRLKQELAIRRAQPGYRFLHLATHGFFEPPPENTRTRRGTFDALSVEYRTYDRNPMLLSGLVLAGANRAPERGVLTAEEVSDLDLRGVELVVLSACETGLGKVTSGEGVLGLQRGFHEAGARSLAVSLWSVSDAATSVLMEEFYANLWQKKMPRLQALRQAQLTVLGNPARVVERRQELRAELTRRGIAEDVLDRRGLGHKAVKVEAESPGARTRSHPAWWAAFILSGDVFR